MHGLKAVIFDWGDTVMRDFPCYDGPMAAVLAQLQGSFLCCLASNAGASDADLMGRALARLGLRSIFQYLFTAHEPGVCQA